MSNDMFEMSHYYGRCVSEYPENMKTILSYEHYTNAQSYSAMAEVAYILDNDGQLPPWGIVIESFSDNVFVHNDLTKAN